MLTLPFRPSFFFGICLSVLAVFTASCGNETVTIPKNENTSRLVGLWILKARVTAGAEVPVTDRLMQLSFKDNGTFRAEYKGEESQKWITAGTGGFSYSPPMLTLYWDSGSSPLTLLVEERGKDSFLLHHGRNMVPLKDQESDEIFVRKATTEAAPRRSS